MQKVNSSTIVPIRKPKLKIPSQEDINSAHEAYQQYLSDLEFAESDYRLSVFEYEHGQTKEVPKKKEVKRPSNKVFNLLTFYVQREKNISPESRLLQTAPQRTRLGTASIRTRSVISPPHKRMFKPGHIPPTSRLGNLSGVIPIKFKYIPSQGTEMRSRVVMKRTIDVGRPKSHAECIREKKKKEEEEAIIEANEFDKEDYVKYKANQHELKARSERGKDCIEKSRIYTPEDA